MLKYVCMGRLLVASVREHEHYLCNDGAFDASDATPAGSRWVLMKSQFDLVLWEMQGKYCS
jgi:hypothetical protein